MISPLRQAVTVLLLATKNRGKVLELRKMLSGLPIEISDLDEHPGIETIPESGNSFQENARIKAAGYAKVTGMYTIADDSGLEVEALAGRPGVLSARYGGEGLTSHERNLLLLGELNSMPDEQRRARFVAAIAMADPMGEILFECEGTCDGTVAERPSGEGGFGYDPVFMPAGYDRTFAELPAETKNAISHRSKAMNIFVRFLLDFTGF